MLKYDFRPLLFFGLSKVTIERYCHHFLKFMSILSRDLRPDQLLVLKPII